MEGHGLTLAGAIFMAISWSLVIGLNLFCFYKIINSQQKEEKGENVR
jgi:hypothetical protein